MFQRNKKEIDVRMIDLSSKAGLKMSCIQSCGGDMAKAQELYDFFIKDMELPDMPTPKQNIVQKFTQQADALFGWVDQNGEKFIKGYNMIQMLSGRAPIPMQAAETVAENIPPLPTN